MRASRKIVPRERDFPVSVGGAHLYAECANA